MEPTEFYPVMLSFIGIEHEARKSLVFLFTAHNSDNYQVVDDHPDAVRIVDIDDPQGKAVWENLKKNGGDKTCAPVVLLGQNTSDLGDTPCLQKPFLPQQLLGVVDAAVEKHRTDLMAVTHNGTQPPSADLQPFSATVNPHNHEGLASIGTTADVNLDDPEAIREVQFDPEQFLAHHIQHLIERADKEQKYIQVGCCDVTFYLDPFDRCIRTLVKEKNLRIFGTLPINPTYFKYQKQTRLPSEIEDLGSRFDYENFLWRMVLAASRGRLPLDTDLDQPFVLQRKPDLTLLLAFPHAEEISDLWAEAPKSIREILAQLPVAQKYVFAY
ncbi:hypothetical protein, partial [Thiolapillus sp.]